MEYPVYRRQNKKGSSVELSNYVVSQVKPSLLGGSSMIIPVPEWSVTPIDKPLRPFERVKIRCLGDEN